MHDLPQAVADLLRTDRRITAAGVCYLLRGLDLPPTFDEAERVLDHLIHTGHATAAGHGEFGTEYLKVFVRHTCNPAKPGQPLPWGRKAEPGKCPRCDELRAGDAPREAPPAIRKAAARQADDDRRSAEIKAHFAPGGPHATGACGPVCTAHDW